MQMLLVQGPSLQNHCPVSLSLNPLSILFSLPGSLESLTAGETGGGGPAFEQSGKGTWESQLPEDGDGVGRDAFCSISCCL